MKKLQPILASAGGSILVLLIAWLGRIPLLPADFLPALLPLLIDPSFSKPARPLFWSGPALLAAECLALLSAPSLGYWIPGMNAAFLCCVVLLDTLFSYTRCWKDALYCRRGKVSRISGETLTRSSLLSLSAFVAVCPVCFYLDRTAVGRGYLLCAALSGLLLAGVFGWALGSRLRKRRLVFALSRIRAEHRALQEKETDKRRVRSYSDSAHELYARAVEMMRSKKPFLLYEFTLYDMAQRLFTNKMYLSRTINTFSGRGFRSFVNFFRIQYFDPSVPKDAYHEGPCPGGALRLPQPGDLHGGVQAGNGHDARGILYASCPGPACAGMSGIPFHDAGADTSSVSSVFRTG